MLINLTICVSDTLDVARLVYQAPVMYLFGLFTSSIIQNLINKTFNTI